MLTQLRNFRALRKADAHRRRPHLEPLEVRAVLSAISVWNTLDSGPGSLRQAVLDANAQEGADVIRFESSAYGEIELSAELGAIVITDDLTIKGPGQNKLTVSGEGVTRVFSVLPDDQGTAPEVTFQKLTIADGYATDAPLSPFSEIFAEGGGIYGFGATLNVDRVSMTGNRAEGVVVGAGGAVTVIFGGSVTVTRSQFFDNAAVGGSISLGGAIAQDIAFSETPGAVSVSHSEFSDNKAMSLSRFVDPNDPFVLFAGNAGGGAIACYAAPMTLQHCSFFGNEAIGGNGVGDNDGGQSLGGAVEYSDISPFGAFDGSLQVSHSTFVGNVARGGEGGPLGGAGGIGVAGGVLTGMGLPDNPDWIRHSSFIDNQAVGGAGGDNGGSGGLGAAGGIGAYSGAVLSVEFVALTHNKALGGVGGNGGGQGGDGQGGGIAADITLIPGFGDDLPPSVAITRSLLVGNVAAGGDGGSDGGPGGSGGGGGLGVFHGATANVSRSIFAGNKALGGDGAGGGDGGNGQGGAVYNGADSTTTMLRSIVFANLARGGRGDTNGADGLGEGGGLFNDEDGLFELDALTRFRTRFNEASDDGDDLFGTFTLL